MNKQTVLQERFGFRSFREGQEALIDALKRHNVRIVTSSDAHCPEDVGYGIREMLRLLDRPAT